MVNSSLVNIIFWRWRNSKEFDTFISTHLCFKIIEGNFLQIRSNLFNSTFLSIYFFHDKYLFLLCEKKNIVVIFLDCKKSNPEWIVLSLESDVKKFFFMIIFDVVNVVFWRDLKFNTKILKFCINNHLQILSAFLFFNVVNFCWLLIRTINFKFFVNGYIWNNGINNFWRGFLVILYLLSINIFKICNIILTI